MSTRFKSSGRFSLSLALLALLGCTGCSTVLEGRSQQISINSAPQGAQCMLKQADEVVARITTPATAEVRKTKNDLVVFCSKSGFESVTVNNHSDYSIASLGNMVLGQYSFIGNAVDTVSGATNKYESKVFVRLNPAEAPIAFPAPPGAPPIVKLSEQVATAMSIQVPMPGTQAAPASVAASLVTPAPVIASKPAPVAPLDPETTYQAVPVYPIASNALSAPVKLPFVLPAAGSSNPSLHAAAVLANATKRASIRFQVPAQSYAEAMNESSRRPPFNVDQ